MTCTECYGDAAPAALCVGGSVTLRATWRECYSDVAPAALCGGGCVTLRAAWRECYSDVAPAALCRGRSITLRAAQVGTGTRLDVRMFSQVGTETRLGVRQDGVTGQSCGGWGRFCRFSPRVPVREPGLGPFLHQIGTSPRPIAKSEENRPEPPPDCGIRVGSRRTVLIPPELLPCSRGAPRSGEGSWCFWRFLACPPGDNLGGH